MPGLNIGCCGFPVGRDRYFPEFDTVEIATTAVKIPKLATAERWRAEAPKGFKFSVRAPRDFTGDVAPFRETPVVRDRRKAFRAVLEVLNPSFVVYETPASFYPSADHMRAMYDFFKGPGRGPWRSVWIPRGRQFNDKLKAKICSDLLIMMGVDALNADEAPRNTRYWRMSGRLVDRRITRGVSFSDAELRAVMARCASGTESFIFFENAAMWRDARRLKKLSITGKF